MARSRALAGLVSRYVLASTTDETMARARFEEAWPLFVQEFPDEDGTAARVGHAITVALSATDLTRFAGIPEDVKLRSRPTLRLHAAPQPEPAPPAPVVAGPTALQG